MFVARNPRWIIVFSILIFMPKCWSVQTNLQLSNDFSNKYQINSSIPFNADQNYKVVNNIKTQKQVESSNSEKDLNILKGGREGEVITRYPNGNKKMQINFHAGQPHGKWKVWYTNGQLAMETNWVNGLPEGKAIHWYADGKKQGELNFVQGKGEGRWQRWHQNGQLWQDMTVHLGNVQTLTVWDKEGHLLSDLTMHNHKQSGVVLSWYPSGSKRSESIFKEDKLISKTEWDETGNVIGQEEDN